MDLGGIGEAKMTNEVAQEPEEYNIRWRELLILLLFLLLGFV